MVHARTLRGQGKGLNRQSRYPQAYAYRLNLRSIMPGSDPVGLTSIEVFQIFVPANYSVSQAIDDAKAFGFVRFHRVDSLKVFRFVPYCIYIGYAETDKTATTKCKDSEN